MKSRLRHRHRQSRQGFTLIELLVVISIIGVLVGLLLPAVQSARAAARRMQCQNNMKNIVLGIQGYVTTKNVYPPAGVFGEDNAGLVAASNNVTTDPSTGAILSWIYNQTSAQIGTPMYSWVVPILPYIDNQELYDQWSMYATTAGTAATVSYLDQGSANTANGGIANLVAGQASNYTISNTSIGILRCPDDVNTQTNEGNLSYVVNGGFTLFHAYPVGWVPSVTDADANTTGLMTWAWSTSAAAAAGTVPTIGVTQKLGVMFLQSVFPQGTQAKVPWNVNSSPASISDGAANTILLSENTLVGVSSGTPYSFSNPTNWACPLPTFCMFIGPTNVCGSPTVVPTAATAIDCTAAGVGTYLGAISSTGADGPGWAYANKVGITPGPANINGGGSLSIDGGYPFSNSNHSSGCNMGFCDGGVRFISNTIDGTVYSKMITSAGSKLPYYVKQMPLNQDSFTN